MSEPTVLLVVEDALPIALEGARVRGIAQTNFELPPDPWWLGEQSITCVGPATENLVVPIVEAVRRGVDLVITVPDEPWVAPLIRDLGRLGDLHVGEPTPPDPLELLNGDQRELLELLATGHSIPEAAAELFLSVRTAERRLGAARRLLGTRTTAEAVLLVGGRS